MLMNKSLQLQRGFTLIELAVVLVIVSILIGSFISTFGSRIDITRRAETVEALEEIKTALYGFAISQPTIRLPCPDVNNDGLEDFDALIPANCAALTTHGNLPWATLGVERVDAWSSTYSYWASNTYASTAGFNLTVNAIGEARVDDNSTAPPAINTLANNVAAVIFSHGKNKYGGISQDNIAQTAVPAGASYNDERENQDTDAAAPVIFIYCERGHR